MSKYSHEENAGAITATLKTKMQQVTEKVTEEQFQDICAVEVIYEEESDKKDGEVQIKDLKQIPPKMEDNNLKKLTPTLWKS